MVQVMPSQVVQTIDELFTHAVNNQPNASLHGSHSSKLSAILNLIKEVPQELLVLTSGDYADFVLAISTIEDHFEYWRRGNPGQMAHVKGFDAITVLRRILAKCPDEYPPAVTTELSFVTDVQLRDSIRRDLGAANRALQNGEWKAATVLAGAAIEALLLWRLQEPSPGVPAAEGAALTLASGGKMKKPGRDMDRWDLDQFIKVVEHLQLLKPDTSSAAQLAKNFRNLIHPGRAIRLNQACDRATALSAVGALEHVIRDLT
jgi:hypothetical protein